MRLKLNVEMHVEQARCRSQETALLRFRVEVLASHRMRASESSREQRSRSSSSKSLPIACSSGCMSRTEVLAVTTFCLRSYSSSGEVGILVKDL